MRARHTTAKLAFSFLTVEVLWSVSFNTGGNAPSRQTAAGARNTAGLPNTLRARQSHRIRQIVFSPRMNDPACVAVSNSSTPTHTSPLEPKYSTNPERLPRILRYRAQLDLPVRFEAHTTRRHLGFPAGRGRVLATACAVPSAPIASGPSRTRTNPPPWDRKSHSCIPARQNFGPREVAASTSTPTRSNSCAAARKHRAYAPRYGHPGCAGRSPSA